MWQTTYSITLNQPSPLKRQIPQCLCLTHWSENVSTAKNANCQGGYTCYTAMIARGKYQLLGAKWRIKEKSSLSHLGAPRSWKLQNVLVLPPPNEFDTWEMVWRRLVMGKEQLPFDARWNRLVRFRGKKVDMKQINRIKNDMENDEVRLFYCNYKQKKRSFFPNSAGT